jgi:hypothetical protein
MSSDFDLFVCDTRQRRAFARQEARARHSMYGDGPDQYGWLEMKVGGRWLHEDIVWGQDLEYTDVRDRMFRQRYDSSVLYTAPAIHIGAYASPSIDSDNWMENVPELVQRCKEKFAGRKLVMINDELIELIDSWYQNCVVHARYKCADRDEVISFLKEHKGKRAFARNT